MKLHFSPTSPYVRKVMVTAKEAGIDGDMTLADAVVSPIAPSDAVRLRSCPFLT